MWCNPCRAVGIIHCAHPDECGNMLSDEAAADNWKAWLDDLPLDAGFSEGIGQVQDFISGTVARAEAAETALAAMTKERDELRASIAWVDEVYPERIEAGGAGIQITWEEFNAMQASIGVTVDKRIGGPEGKAVHNQRLRSALAAERAKVAKLVDLLCLADEAIMQEHGCFPMDRTNERQIFLNDACTAIRKITGDDYTERKRRARAAITEAGQ